MIKNMASQRYSYLMRIKVSFLIASGRAGSCMWEWKELGDEWPSMVGGWG